MISSSLQNWTSALRYVCISDLHFGSPTALLTDTPAVLRDDAFPGYGTGALRDAFATALVATCDALSDTGTGGDLPGIVLLGDILDLSLGTPHGAMDTCDAFLQSLARAGGGRTFGPVVFVPGNHDHALWTATRLQAMAGGTEQDDRYVHTTRAFAAVDQMPEATLLSKLLERNGFAAAATFYPNMGMQGGDNSLVVLHHGHFIEPIYRAMSTLSGLLDGTPGIAFDAETLEQLNASWIDFIWSTDGDNGRLGAQIERAHNALFTGGADIRFEHRLADILAREIAGRLPLPRTAQARSLTVTAARAVVETVLGRYAQMERFSYQQALGADGLAGLETYLAETVRRQIDAECRAGASKPADPPKKNTDEARELTFIFGHTHKPFETRVAVPGYATPPAVYNTGGWDMDTPMFGTKLGASVVLIDDDLGVAALGICQVPQHDDASPQGVQVKTADGVIAPGSIADALQKVLNADELTPNPKRAWDVFSQGAAKAYRAKQAYIMAQVDAGDGRDDQEGRHA